MLTAKDIMTRDVVTVRPETSIEELASLLVRNQISGAPVVDANGALAGIVTENDLISRNKRLHTPTVVSFLDAAIYLESSKKFADEVKRVTATKVADICATLCQYSIYRSMIKCIPLMQMTPCRCYGSYVTCWA